MARTVGAGVTVTEAETMLRHLIAEVDSGTARIESVTAEISSLNPSLVKFIVVAADTKRAAQGDSTC